MGDSEKPIGKVCRRAAIMKFMPRLFLLFFSTICFVCACSKGKDQNQELESQEDSKISASAHPKETKSKVKIRFDCDYLGMPLPGDIPEKFAPGIVSTDSDDSCFEISVSGHEIIFSREMKIYLIKQDRNGIWSSPFPLSFSGSETSFSKDGRAIYFNNRDHFPGAKVALNVWVSRKLEDGWGEPNHFGAPVIDQTVHAPSFAENGNLYASGLIRLKYNDGEYQEAEQLKPEISGFHPFVAADESFLIFDRRPSSGGNPADLYITFRDSNDTWTEPISVGAEINSSALETNAFVTADGKFMFFTRQFDVYWVKADFIGRIEDEVLR